MFAIFRCNGGVLKYEGETYRISVPSTRTALQVAEASLATLPDLDPYTGNVPKSPKQRGDWNMYEVQSDHSNTLFRYVRRRIVELPQFAHRDAGEFSSHIHALAVQILNRGLNGAGYRCDRGFFHR